MNLLTPGVQIAEGLTQQTILDYFTEGLTQSDSSTPALNVTTSLYKSTHALSPKTRHQHCIF